MKKLIFSICCAALVSPLIAQTPASNVPAAQVVVEQASHRSCDTACPQACTTCNKVCVSEPTIKKHTKVVYASKCIDYCLPKCALGGNCNSCEANCGHVRTKNVLMKRVVTEECPSSHCVVREGAACAPTCRAGHGKCCVETAPAPAAPVMPKATTTAQPLPTGSQALRIESAR